jgi:hypothetical protein
LFRHPTPLEERHFIEVVTAFRDRQNKTGKNLSRQLRAELRRFGYIAMKGGLQIDVEIMDDLDEEPVDDDAVIEYLELLERIVAPTAGKTRVEGSGGDLS